MSAPANRFELRLGFIPLNDCALLAVAQERGIFQRHGLNVALSREPSWANIRDKVAYGLFDAAHMLAPMSIAAALEHGRAPPIIAPMALGLNGNAITVSNALFEEMRAADPAGMAHTPRTAAPLARVIRARRAAGQAKPTFAIVFPYSAQNYELRDWLSESGVDPARDVSLVVVPPPRMLDLLRANKIDGYCVGGPWNALAESKGVGKIVLAAYEYWGLKPEKVLGVSSEWAAREPAALQALVMALLEAGQWADAAENADELATILAQPGYVGADQETIRFAFTAAERRFLILLRSAALFPWVSHGLWFAAQMARWGQAEEGAAIAAARAVYRPDLFRQAAAAIGMNAPRENEKVEGGHGVSWEVPGTNGPISMYPDQFFHTRAFDPARG
jgi:two-component system, oxyanion-binding sensor